MIASALELDFNPMPVEARANYPVMPPHHGDRSSRKAAALVARSNERLWTMVLDGLAKGPNNADALAAAAGEPWWNLRTRMTELAHFNAIYRTRLTGRSAHGNPQGIYALSAGPLDPRAPVCLRLAHEAAIKLALAHNVSVSGRQNN